MQRRGPKFIGGFFELRIPDRARPDGVLSYWCPPGGNYWLLHNARSAIAALLQVLESSRVWLPAYICREVASAIPASCTVEYYSLDDQLLPVASELERQIMPGDHVLAVDYFGRPASASIGDVVKKRRDVGWIQDCAHALDGPEQAWGDWQLYSPRKLLGVADGGIAVSTRRPLPPISTVPLSDQSFALPSMERLEDREGTQNVRWYTHYREVEARMKPGLAKMSDLTTAVMRSAAVAEHRDARARNYAALRQQLGGYAFFKDPAPAFTPLGFPIVVESAALTSERLARRGIFAARHWADLPSDAARFEREHDLSRHLLTIPCDYRYDEEDMLRVADEVELALRA